MGQRRRVSLGRGVRERGCLETRKCGEDWWKREFVAWKVGGRLASGGRMVRRASGCVFDWVGLQ